MPGRASDRGSTTPAPAEPSALWPQEVMDDYHSLRGGMGARQVTRDVVRVSGPDAVAYLQGQCSQDVERLAPGASADSLLLSPQGKLEALVRVTRTADDEMLLDTEGGFGPAVADRLQRFKLRVRLVIEPLPWRCVSLRGPVAAERFAPDGAVRAPGDLPVGTALAVAFSWNGVTGVDLLGEEPGVPEGARLCSADAWEAVRVEAGIPAMGTELDGRTIPVEADLLDRCVSFTKGCYTGQELVARLDARGNKVARRLRGLVLDPDTDDRSPRGAGIGGAPAAGGALVPRGASVERAGKAVGTVTSSAWSPGAGAVAALAYVHRGVEPGDRVDVDVRDQVRAARVTLLPLV